ncbi:hypothetical protein ACQCVH_23355 [Bacillus infantis]|uniref:hypothetical protein n=1 Tax=Bacillus infantis TaxID=324767 RepID=UPI003CEEE711
MALFRTGPENLSLWLFIYDTVILIVKELDRRLGMTIKKLILLILFWLLIIFSVTAQLSEEFILWLRPNAVSLIDERMSYTFGPMLINFIVVFLLWKSKIRKNLLHLLLLCNAVFFLYYIYYQFGDMGLGKFR